MEPFLKIVMEPFLHLFVWVTKDTKEVNSNPKIVW